MFDEQNKQMIGNCIVNALDLDQAEVKLSEAAHYDDESKTTRLERRRGRWMKVTLV